MAKYCFAGTAVAFGALALWAGSASATMGPCKPAVFDLLCGSGDGAARVILKTLSPSKRLAFAWRNANEPPTTRPEENDPNLQNFVVRLDDGAVLARSHGAYWDLGTKIAKAYLMSAWSPDSHLLIKVEQRADSASAELFSFGENDAAIGPFDLVNVVKPAVMAKMTNSKQTSNPTLVFAAHPAMTVNDQGVMHAGVFMMMQDADGPPYDVILQIARIANSINAKVMSVTPHAGPTVSIIVQ